VKTKTSRTAPLDNLQYLPSFARYLLEHKLNEFMEVQVRISQELDIPMLRAFRELNPGQRAEILRQRITNFLGRLSENKARQQIEESIEEWKGGRIPSIDKDRIVAEDITMLSYLRRKSFLYFLPDYCSGSEQMIEIIGEMDIFLLESETAQANTYIGLLKSSIDEHVHFIQKVADTSPGIIYVYDVKNRKHIYMNRSVTDYLGYTAEEVLDPGNKLEQLIHPDDHAVIHEYEKNSMGVADNEVRSVKFRIRNSRGEYRWMRSFEHVFRRDKEGNITERIGISIDVNDQMVTAERLKLSESLFREAESLTHLGNYTWDLRTNELNWSEELYRIYGLDPEKDQIDFNRIAAFNLPEDNDLVSRETQQALAERRPFDFYYRIRRADGNMRVLHARGKIMSDSEGEPCRVLGTVQDETERQTLIKELRQRDELYRQAEALANMGNYTLDVITGAIEWTDQLYRIYGMEPQSETITFDRFLSFVHPQDKEVVERTAEELFTTGSSDYIFRIMTDQGEVRTIRSIAHVVKDTNGNALRVIGTEQDITERQDLVQRLQRSESLYRQAEQMGNMGNWSWDLISGKLEWTDQLYRIYGMEPGQEEITIEKFLDFIHPEDRENVELGIDKSFSETELDYTFRIVLKDGKIKTLRSISHVHRDEHGIPIYMVGTERDITDKQNLIDRLRHSDHLYKQAQQLAHIGNWSWHLHSGKVEWSDELYRIFGLEPQSIQLDLDTYSSLLHPEDREMVLATVKQSVDEHKSYELVHRILQKNGKVKVVQAYGEVVLDKDGQPYEVVGTAQDVTEMHTLIAQLKHSQQLYKHAQQLANIGNWSWEMESGKVEWSDELYDIYEIPRGTPLTYENVADYMHPDDRGPVLNYLEECIRTGTVYDTHHRIILPDGREKTIHRRAEVVKDKDGKPLKLVGITQDVTERQNLINRLQESEQLYKQAQSLSHIGNWSMDLKTLNYTWSDEMYRIYEIERGKEVTAKEWENFIHPEDKEDVLAYLHECLEERKSYDKAHRIVLRNGKIKTVHRKAEFRYNDKGEPLMMVGTSQDVTEQHRIQQELKENQTFIRKITDATPSIIASYNVNTGRYVFISEGLEKLLGYPTSEVTEKGVAFFAEIIHPEDAQAIMEKNMKALEDVNRSGRNDLVVEFIYRMRHSNGGYRWFHTYGTIFDRNREGMVEHILNISLDVTEQVQATQTIKEQEHFIQQIADASPTILYLFDVEKDSIVYINREIFFVLGYIPEEIIGAGPAITEMLYHPEDYKELPLRRLSEKKFQADSMIQYECRMKNKEGDWRWLLVREIAFKTDSKGEITQILGAALDINRRKEMEKSIVQNSFKLEQSNASLEEFAYVASHDLKEPLRKISTFGDRLMETEMEKLEGPGKMYLRKIVDASQRMQIMINDLLAISMISGNTAFEPFSLQTILEDTLQTLEFKIEQQNAIVKSDPLPQVEIIPSQFRQLFQNLLSNSLKFVREGMQPEVSIRHSVLAPQDVDDYQVAASEKYHKIEFSDNGIGFENEFAGKIFAIFQRLHGRSEYEGSGIGLAICKKIVEHHGGVIYAAGEPGQGSTFTIILPS
jgi:PAS domain S-box-containing protein